MDNSTETTTATFEAECLVMVNMQERWRFTVPTGVTLTTSEMEDHIRAHHEGEPFGGVTVELVEDSAYEYDHYSRSVHLPLGVQVLP